MNKLLVLLFVSSATALFAQDISGTYTGVLKADGPAATLSRATVILKQDAGKLTVSAGPVPQQQTVANNVVKDGDSIKFEIMPPGALGAWKFAVTVKDNRIAGQVIAPNASGTTVGQVDLVKQEP